MTQHVSSSPGNGGGGPTPSGSLSTSSGRRNYKPASRGDGAGDIRNQCITDFFRPAPKQDRTMLCSSEKRRGKAELPGSCAERLRKNLSSPKQNRRRKLSFSPPNRSPIIEAFSRSAKKKDNPGDTEANMTLKTIYPKDVSRKLFILDGSPGCSRTLTDDICLRNLEKSERCPLRTRTPLVENSEYVDLDTSNSDLSQWFSASEKNSLKMERSISCYPKTGCTNIPQSNLVNSSIQLPLETCSREKEVKERKMQTKQQPFLKKSSRINVSNKGTKELLKGSCLTSQESSSDESSLPALQAVSSSELCSSKTINLTNSKLGPSLYLTKLCPSLYLNSRTSLGITKHKEGSGKQKRISQDNFMKDSQEPAVQSTLKGLSSGEDENSDCNLDSSEEEEEEEVLLSLDEILARSTKPPATKQEQTHEIKDGTQEAMISSHNVYRSKRSGETSVSFVNRLENFLKEKEEFRRVNELEKQLQLVKQGAEMTSPPEELSSDGELSAEHRAVTEKYSIIDAIPDQHPGENVFQIVYAGKIFNQHNLDLKNSGLQLRNPIDKYLLESGITQQLFVITEGLLTTAYHSSPCPVPILKWMFQMMSIHSDSSISRKILDMLMALTVKNNSTGDDQPRPWIPSVFDIATVLINMGVPFISLFPLLPFQPTFTEKEIMSQMQKIVRKQASGNVFGNSTSFFLVIETNLCNMAKFLQLCISINPRAYTDKEIILLLLLLFKLSLEKELKQFPLVDLECLIIKLLENISEWDAEMPEICRGISYLSSHHHDLLWLVQFVPNWTRRGRQIRQHLSLVVIAKLLKSNVTIPSDRDQQMSLLCHDLVKMKPSALLKMRVAEMKPHDDLNKASLFSEFEPQAYYLTYVLLHFVREASNSEATTSSERKWLLKLCGTLEKHVKCDIREDGRLFYRTKVKDLVARTYSRWQQMIHSSRATQGKFHDFWVPDS